MKPYRGTLMLLGVLALLGAFVYVLEFRDPGPAAPAADGLVVWSLVEEEIQELTAVDGDRRLTLARGEGGSWTIAGAGGAAADEWKVASLTSQAARLRADRIVAEAVDDPASFGLEPVKTSLKVSLAGGATEELVVGNQNPLSTCYYARKAGDETLYLIPPALVGALRSLVSEPAAPTPEPVSTPAFEPTPAATATPPG